MTSVRKPLQNVLRAIVIAWTMAFAAMQASYGQKTPSAVLIKNVRIFDGNHAELTPPSDLLIENDTISKISTAPLAAPDGFTTTILDGSGKVLIPGLIDAHWHTIGGDSGEADLGYNYLVAGVGAKETLLRGFTTVRDLAGPSFGLKKAIDQELIEGPRIYPSGAFITQTGGHGDFRKATDLHPRFGGNTPAFELQGFSILADGRDQVLAAVREQLRLGASQIKLGTTGGVMSEFDPLDSLQFTSDEIKAAVEAASDWGTYVTVHNYSSEGARRAIEAGVKVIEHGQLLDEPTVKLLAEKGIWLSTQPFPVEKQSDLPAVYQNDRKYAKFLTVTENTDHLYKLAKKYNVKIAFGTDLGGAGARAALQSQRLVSLRQWFTPAEILHQATGANGELLALSGRRNPYPKKLGVIEPGAYADLLLVNGNPLEDITLLGTPDKSLAVIVKNGEVVKNILAK